MSNIAIRVENLSKLYKIGARRNRHDTLRDHLAHGVKSLFSRNGHHSPPSAERLAHDVLQPSDTFWALKDVSFEVKRGEVIGIIGRNGAGKSTLLKILSRITEPTSGFAEIHGQVGSLLEVGTGFHPELTGRENIYLTGAILGMKKAEIESKFDEIVAFSEIEKFIDTPVKRYSSGMYVRLAFAVAAHLDPETLIVDEVLAVGDASFQKKCLGKMGDVAKEGRTVLFVSHNTVAVQNLCQRTILLDGGRVSFEGDTHRAMGIYLQGTPMSAITGTSLRERTDRSGNGKIRLTGFRMEDIEGHSLQLLQTGRDVVFVFGYECAPGVVPNNVDVGFSFDTELREGVFALYASYVGQMFAKLPTMGSFRCVVRKLAVVPGRYWVGARVTVAGEEADRPQDGVGYVDVMPGDFYGSGSRGYAGRSYLLVDGTWRVSAE
jgi:lipopolysaccharide transport system ATP-binding protein